MAEAYTPENPMLQAALRYADNGWHVFPLHGVTKGQCTCRMKCSSPGKHPLTKNGLLEATTDPEKIEEWFTRYPNANVGIRTGSQSQLWVLDVDNKRSIEVGHQVVGLGDHSIRELEDSYEPLPETRIVHTGSGGTHYYYQWADGCSGNRADVLPGIDVRGEGGYVVAPPSAHVSGHSYTWGNEDLLPTPMPVWLADWSRTVKTETEDVADDEIVSEGGRNTFLHRLGAKYRREQGYREFQLYGLLMAHNFQQCKPPLPREEVMRIAESCAKYEYIKPVDLSAWETSGPPPIPEGGDLAISLYELIKNPPTPPEPLVHGVISVGTGVLIAGQPNVGKSWVVMDLALSVSSGLPWMDCYNTNRGPVLMIDEEGTAYGQYERFKMLLDGHNDMSAAGLDFHLAIGTGMRLDSDVGITRIRRMLERYRPRLVVIDSLVRMHGGDENNAQTMSKFFEITKELMRTYDTTFLFTHHVRKPSLDTTDPGDLIRGTTEIRAWPDTIFVVTPGSDNQEVIFHHVKSRWGRRSDPFKVRMAIDDEDKTAKLAHAGEVEPNDRSIAAQNNKVLKAIVDLNESGVHADTEAIAEFVGRTERTVRDYISGLVRSGAIEAVEVARGSGRPKLYYRIKGA